MESEGNGKKSLGNFRNMKTTGICFEDLTNAFTFFSLLLNTNSFIKWLMDNRLLASDVKCEKCNATYSLYKRIKMPDGVAWRCKKNANHEISIRKHSFFSKMKYTMQDVLVFIREMVLGSTLQKSCLNAGVYYGHTAVDYSNQIRYVTQ